MNATATKGSRFDLWISTLNGRDRAILNYGLWVISVLLVVLAMAILGQPQHSDSGNGLPAGAQIQIGKVITGQAPVDAFNEDVRIDTSHVESR